MSEEFVAAIVPVADATRYPVEAFLFVHNGLGFSVERIHGEWDGDDENMEARHISGRDLCWGLRDYALNTYGLLARTVLAHWRIHACEDFGRIVFAMVDAGLLNKTERDSMRDFLDVYDFDEAFTPVVRLGAQT